MAVTEPYGCAAGLGGKRGVSIRPGDGAGGRDSSALRRVGPNGNHEFQMSAGGCSQHDFVRVIH